ncbi:MAG: AbrB/MazE/SpoVT family DNA-binding domain-containing protein [Nanoarchaeota archaeon]|nr:AbrB/MazE/SpoVT family DNA-binding domain-containing protein [Nanoarchaeota archaeon]MBU1005014.1 AbrB/MazE/SpoVT family DNA-binding domain-containing protein [Nanoarchaeota archaeon]MBU1945906.1 AbrB/MazE/SpoVT family DNA-binding domain-containing protein [Nanoarchaeota archaeon]
MKRRVIQIANSTQLISLPRKWAIQHGIKKGDELEIKEEGSKIIVSTEKDYKVKVIEMNIDGWGIMVPRLIHALYKKGVEEIKVNFSSEEDMGAVQSALGKEAVGYEITNQGNNFCEIKHISGELEEFESILKRTFLLLVSMSEQTLESIKKNNFNSLMNIAFLEEANNRFTTACRRFLNKGGEIKYFPRGPMYYILEGMENLADQYKYLCKHLYSLGKKNNKRESPISKNVINSFENVHAMLNRFYELFYKFDKNKLIEIAKKRKEVIDNLCSVIETSPKVQDRVLAHYLIVIAQEIFCFIGPYLVLNS